VDLGKSAKEVGIQAEDWVAYVCFVRGASESADTWYKALLDWSKENPPPANLILCRFDTGGTNYTHYVGCVANQGDCIKINSWLGNDFFKYQQETNTLDLSIARDSGLAPVAQ
jgi:hypothetical protein